jgi:hypothetical protein
VIERYAASGGEGYPIIRGMSFRPGGDIVIAGAAKYRSRILFALLTVACFVTGWITLFRQSADPPQLDGAPAQVLFDKWPTDRKPDLVLALSGQMYGYLQKCGCSNPQRGGLERRYNFIESLKARGWEVVGLDVGDVPKPLAYTPTSEQTLTKYDFGMQALKMMNYKAVGVGKEELAMPLLNALTKYSVQKGNEFPKVHAANIANREDFPGSNGGSALTESDIVTGKSGLAVGVISVAGAELVQKGIDRSVKYLPQTGPVVTNILKNWKDSGKSPQVNVLLYQGPFEWKDPGTGKKADAQSAAEGFPQFHIVLCKSPDDSDAPEMPTVVNEGKTMICQVGQRGQNIGVIGIFRTDKGIELYYQKVVMSEEFETSAANEAGNPMLKLLQDYSDTVRDNDYLSEMAKRKKVHAVQAQNKNAQYIGDTQCFTCHQSEWAVWSKSKHAHAYEALAKIAKHPVGRNFDGECIICHTVGYEYQTGYLNEKKTPNLKNVQCEACHGPGSPHVAEEAGNAGKSARQQSHKFAAALSPWKIEGKGMMPSAVKLEAMLKEKDPSKRQDLMNDAENKVYLSVYQTCAKCHDLDNDPKFDLTSYWPNVVHTGLKKK